MVRFSSLNYVVKLVYIVENKMYTFQILKLSNQSINKTGIYTNYVHAKLVLPIDNFKVDCTEAMYNINCRIDIFTSLSVFMIRILIGSQSSIV